MAERALPRRITFPSGRRLELRARRAPPVAAAEERSLFGGMIALADQALELTEDGARVDVRDLALSDFHLLRALLLRSGHAPEEEVAIPCRNCEAELRIRPCAALEIGPYVDGELGDPELDATLPFGEAHEVEAIPLGRVRTARTATFAPRTVRQAAPLFRALAREPLDVDADFVRGMGLVSLGPESDVERLAEALATCDDDAFVSVTDAFLASHYPLRLGAAAFCEACGARNDVDAPYERELLPGTAPARAAEHAPSAGEAFPDLDAFAARARAIAAPLLAEVEGEPVELVVEGGTPAVDDGGEPLLGSYVPPHPGDMSSPSRPPTVTVYHRTFRAMWNEEGPYDWEAELTETVEHELEHHGYFLRGEDPMDDEERAEIREEGLRLVGRKEANRRALEGFGSSLGDFARRTWPLFVLLAVALAAMFFAKEP